MEKIEVLGENPNVRVVRAGDELLPRVAPNIYAYGYYKNFKNGDYYAHQSMAYIVDSNGKERLLFGIKNANLNNPPEPDSVAYIHVTDMELNKITSKRLNKAYHINDMMISSDNAKVMVAPLDGKGEGGRSIIREYRYSSISAQFEPIYGIDPINERDLSVYFGNVPIDSMCNSQADKMYIVKGGNKIVFFDYNFNPLRSITIDQHDLHADDIMPQTIECYNGHVLQVNAGNYNNPSMGTTKNAYINVFRPDSSKVDTYRYPDTLVNMEAEGICRIGNGKYFYTHYRDVEIEVRLLNFNTPSHTHILSDIMDMNKLGTVSKPLYVDPQLEGQSYLAPDGSPEKPFPNVAEALAYAKVFQPEAVLHLMDGDYGTVRLNSIPMSVTLKGTGKDTCLIDRIRIDKCKDVLLENITFCNGEAPFEVTSSTVEINNCSFPNGKQSGPDAARSYGMSIAKDSTVTVRDCQVSHFNSAVNITASTLYLEGNNVFKGIENCGIRSENSTIWGAEHLDGTGRSPAPQIGSYYFDTKSVKTLWWNGRNWVDSTGLEYLGNTV